MDYVMPAIIKPQLATAAKRPPSQGKWTWELKLDGYRMLVRIDNHRSRLFTKNGPDWTARLTHLVPALDALGARNAWLGGEAVVINAAGRPDFNALQNAFDRRGTSRIILFVFDLLWLDDVDLRPMPLSTRREYLRTLVSDDNPVLRRLDALPGDPVSLLASPRRLKLEGIIGKRLDAPYRGGRQTDWVKLKCNLLHRMTWQTPDRLPHH